MFARSCIMPFFSCLQPQRLSLFVAILALAPLSNSQGVGYKKQAEDPSARLQQVPDTDLFAATYATALPTPTPQQWEQDYNRYNRFLTPEIKRTQMGLSFVGADGIRTWQCRPSASPHAQLDTMMRVQDATRLVGSWRSVVNRFVTHIDSFSVKDQKFYRSAVIHDQPTTIALQITDQKFMLNADTPKQHLNRKYALINQRYLLLYGASKAGGAISQVGIDAEGRLIIHNCAVTERQIQGRYLTYQTIIWQSILTKM